MNSAIVNHPRRGEGRKKERGIRVHKPFILAAIRWKLSFGQPK
jgi:hypothetical protein